MISILIPYRPTPEREQLWDHCKTLWAATGYEIVTGTSPDGPFNTAAAINDAASKATGDMLMIHGADHLPDTTAINWAAEQLTTHPWVAIYSTTSSYDEPATRAILHGSTPTNLPTQITPFCIADIGIRKDAWIPMDERFNGWGSEDRAWRLALETLYGPTPTSPFTLRTLHHPAAARDNAEANYTLYLEYEANIHRMGDYLAELGS